MVLLSYSSTFSSELVVALEALGSNGAVISSINSLNSRYFAEEKLKCMPALDRAYSYLSPFPLDFRVPPLPPPGQLHQEILEQKTFERDVIV